MYRIVSTREVYQPTVGVFPCLTPNTYSGSWKKTKPDGSEQPNFTLCMFCIVLHFQAVPCIHFLMDRMGR